MELQPMLLTAEKAAKFSIESQLPQITKEIENTARKGRRKLKVFEPIEEVNQAELARLGYKIVFYSEDSDTAEISW